MNGEQGEYRKIRDVAAGVVVEVVIQSLQACCQENVSLNLQRIIAYKGIGANLLKVTELIYIHACLSLRVIESASLPSCPS